MALSLGAHVAANRPWGLRGGQGQPTGRRGRPGQPPPGGTWRTMSLAMGLSLATGAGRATGVTEAVAAAGSKVPVEY